MTKKLIATFVALVSASAFAVEPVAVWNGDFLTTIKGDYTLSANGNTVAADGSSITISTAKGVSVKKTAGGNIGDQASTVIIKYTNFTPPTNSDAQVLIMNHTANTSYKDFIGAASISGGNIHGIWQNTTWGSNKTNTGAYNSALTDTKTFAFSWAQTGTVGSYFWMDGENKNGWSGLHGNLQVDSVWVGGPNESTTLKPATGMKVLAIAVFDSRISDAEIAAYEFPKVAKKNESVLLLNFGKSNPTGWVTCNEMNVGGNIPRTGTLSQEGSSATFRIAGSGNFFNEDNNDFDLVTNGTFSNGAYRGTDGKDYETIEAEVKSSLGLADNVVFDSSVYGCGLQNGGFADHMATIGGLDATAKYIVYVGYGMHKSNQCAGFKITSDQCSSVDSIDYVTTVAGTGTSVVNSYTAANVGAELRPGENGLLIVRLTNVVPTSSGEIKFAPHGERSGINFLAVAKVNEIEESEETETTNYNFDTFLTRSYQDTQWSVTLDDIQKYGTISGKISGNWVDPKNDPAGGYFKTAVVEDGVSAIACQLQVLQSAGGNYLKAVRVVMKYDESTNTIWAKATGSTNQQNGSVGTNFTTWNGTLAQSASSDGYGVASLSLSITKPVDKSVKGTIDEVTTEHSEDYTSNTITAKVTIENKGEYKGDAVLVYSLGETQYVGEIAEGSATITVTGLTQEKVYRGTLALGQKVGEDVTIIEGTEQPVALYQGERQYTWMASPIVIKEATTINAGEGCTAPVPTDMPDYVENCDSVFTVSISAAEAVSEENDAESLKGVQGGVRIAEVGGALKLQVVKNGVWTVFSNAEINKTYVMTVTFHYAKDENDTDPAVSYVLDKTTETSAKMTDKTKVTEVFIADGTVLPDDLTGLFQFDSAVIVDLELNPGEGDYADYNTKAEALAAVEKLKIGICDAVKSVLTTETQQTTYRAYFHLVVVSSPSGEGLYAVMPELKDEVKSAIEEDLEKALADVVNAFNTGSAEIVGKPGLYYGVKSGEDLADLTTGELKMADADGKVSITITKPNGATKHFYRIICSPTPSETK